MRAFAAVYAELRPQLTESDEAESRMPEAATVAAAAFTELDLHGYTCATVLPSNITRVSRVAAALFGVSAVLPAGASIASVGVAVANRPSGDAFMTGRC